MPVPSFKKQHFFKLLGGMVCGHGIALLLLPLFTLAFTPEIFGEFSYYTYFTGFVAGLIGLGYESQIANGKTNKDSHKLVNVTFLLSLINASIVAIFILWPLYSLIDAIAYPLLFALLTAFSAAIANLLSSLQFLYVKEKHYNSLSLSNFYNQAGRSGSQLLVGWLTLSSLGLIAGDILGKAFAIVKSAPKNFTFKQVLYLPTYSEARHAMQHYRADSRWYMGVTLIEIVMMWFPFLAVGTLYGVKEGGIAAMVIRLLFIPSGIVGRAVADLYHSIATHQKNDTSYFGISLPRVGLLIITLSSIAVVIVLKLMIELIGKEALLLYVPVEWHGIYYYISVLLPILAIQCCSQSFGRYAIMHNLNKIKFYMHLLLLVLLGGLFLYSWHQAIAIFDMLHYYVLLFVGVHILYFIAIFKRT